MSNVLKFPSGQQPMDPEQILLDMKHVQELLKPNEGYAPTAYEVEQFKNPGAVGGEASTPTKDLTEAPGEPASMRRMLDCICHDCTFRWVAPALGRCPRCASFETRALSERTNLLKRV